MGAGETAQPPAFRRRRAVCPPRCPPAYVALWHQRRKGRVTPGAIGTPSRPSRKALTDDRLSQTAVSPPVSRTGRHAADRDTPYQQLRAAQLAIGYRVGLRKGPDRANSGLIW